MAVAGTQRAFFRSLGRSLGRYLIAIVWALAAVGFAAIPAGAREKVPSRSSFARIDALMTDQVDRGRIAGSVVRILYKGKPVFARAYGMQDREASVPMRSDSIFRIASQTKAIVSVAVLMLQERGQLLINDPVGNYLPEYMETTVAVKEADGSFAVEPAERSITIRDLLTHTAGIGYGGGPAAELWKKAEIQGWYFAHRNEPIRETVRRIAALPQDAQPGSAFVYGYNTDILGALVEVVSRQPLDEFLQQNIFDPLGMNDTHFYLPAEKADRLATVYGLSPAGELERAPDTSNMLGQGEYVSGPRRSLSGGAGLLSTVGDYSRFLETLRRSGQKGTQKRGRQEPAAILSRKSIELMGANHIGDLQLQPGVAFGLGLSVVTDLGARGVLGSAGELGWGGAYHTSYWIDPQEELVVTYMTQLLPATGANDHTRLRAAIYSSLY